MTSKATAKAPSLSTINSLIAYDYGASCLIQCCVAAMEVTKS